MTGKSSLNETIHRLKLARFFQYILSLIDCYFSIITLLVFLPYSITIGDVKLSRGLK
jgi:hypothetical protein